jgi:hypothetical protein
MIAAANSAATTIIGRLYQVVSAGLAKRASVRRQAVPSELQLAHGSFRNEALTWRTEWFTATPCAQTARMARVDGPSVTTLTVLLIPPIDVAAPLFGADLVAFGGQLTFCAMDVYPVAGPLAAATDAMLQAARDDVSASLRDRIAVHEDGPFSPHAIVASCQKDMSAGVGAAAIAYFDAWCAEVDVAPRGDWEGAAARRLGVENYLARMCTHMQAVVPLQRLFGSAHTDRYFPAFFEMPQQPARELQRVASLTKEVP